VPLPRHLEAEADITIATIPVERAGREGASASWRPMKQAGSGDLVEKPKNEDVLDGLRYVPGSIAAGETPTWPGALPSRQWGITSSTSPSSKSVLDNDLADFGKHVGPQAAIEALRRSRPHLPALLGRTSARSAPFTRRTSISPKSSQTTTSSTPKARFTRTRASFPGARSTPRTSSRPLSQTGACVTDARIERSIVGVRSLIESKTHIVDSVIMGADYYEKEQPSVKESPELPPVGIGSHCFIRRAIIDENARIGNHVVINPEGKPSEYDGDNYYIRDGIVVVPKGAVIPSHTII